MNVVFKVILMVLWAGFFIMNLRSIIYKQVDSGIGVVWMLVALLVFIGLCVLDPDVLELAGDAVMLTMLSAHFIGLCLLYSHEKALTEIRRKNNELAIEIALIYDHMKYVEKTPRTAGTLLSKQDRGE